MVALKIIRRLALAERDIISEPYMINQTIGNGNPHVYGNAVMHIIITQSSVFIIVEKVVHLSGLN